MFLNTQHSLGYCVAKVSKTKFPCKSCPCGNEILLFANWRKSGPGGFFKVKASRSQRRRTYSRADEASETPTTTGTPIKPTVWAGLRLRGLRPENKILAFAAACLPPPCPAKPASSLCTRCVRRAGSAIFISKPPRVRRA